MFLKSSFLTSKELCGLKFAEKLTLQVSQINEQDHEKLKASSYTDEEILHLTQVTAYFNFVNRMAEGLGVSLEGEDHFDLP